MSSCPARIHVHLTQSLNPSTPMRIIFVPAWGPGNRVSWILKMGCCRGSSPPRSRVWQTKVGEYHLVWAMFIPDPRARVLHQSQCLVNIKGPNILLQGATSDSMANQWGFLADRRWPWTPDKLICVRCSLLYGRGDKGGCPGDFFVSKMWHVLNRDG